MVCKVDAYKDRYIGTEGTDNLKRPNYWRYEGRVEKCIEKEGSHYLQLMEEPMDLIFKEFQLEAPSVTICLHFLIYTPYDNVGGVSLNCC